jgi:hypothetical protein
MPPSVTSLVSRRPGARRIVTSPGAVACHGITRRIMSGPRRIVGDSTRPRSWSAPPGDEQADTGGADPDAGREREEHQAPDRSAQLGDGAVLRGGGVRGASAGRQVWAGGGGIWDLSVCYQSKYAGSVVT